MCSWCVWKYLNTRSLYSISVLGFPGFIYMKLCVFPALSSLESCSKSGSKERWQLLMPFMLEGKLEKQSPGVTSAD